MKRRQLLIIILLIIFTIGCSNNKDANIKNKIIDYSISKEEITKKDDDMLYINLNDNQDYDYAYSLLSDIEDKIKEEKPKKLSINYKFIYGNHNTVINLDQNGLSNIQKDKLKNWFNIIADISTYDNNYIYIDNWYIKINSKDSNLDIKSIIEDIVNKYSIKTIKIEYENDFDFQRIDDKTKEEIASIISDIDYKNIILVSIGL